MMKTVHRNESCSQPPWACMIPGSSMTTAESGRWPNIKGIRSHQTVENALKIVENLKHRAGKDADGKTGGRRGHSAADLP